MCLHLNPIPTNNSFYNTQVVLKFLLGNHGLQRLIFHDIL